MTFNENALSFIKSLKEGLLMQKNMANWDRIGRVLLGIIFIFLAIKHGGLIFDLLGVVGLVSNPWI